MNKRQKRSIAFGLFLLLCSACFACGSPAVGGSGADPAATMVELSVPVLTTPVPASAHTAIPTATPEPTPAYATIGAVGDIMSPGSVITGAWYDGGKTEHDFSTMFELVRPFAQSVDLMCGNLETTISGFENGGYTDSAKGRTNTFNAPDSLATDLRECGFDVLTTGNNHCCDRYMEGMFRTATYVRELGFVQTGTYLNEQERQQPCIVEVNGIRIGIVAATLAVNLHKIRMNDEQLRVNVSMLMNRDLSLTDEMREDVRRVCAADPDFVIGFIHWDAESPGPTLKETKEQARELLELGVDCILASHPHRVREAEYLTVTRGTEEYTGLVVYSMGNFLCSETVDEAVGLLMKLTLMKAPDGQVTLEKAEYMPTICYVQRVGYDRMFQIVPALTDQTRLNTRYDEITETLAYGLKYARSISDDTYELNTVLEQMDEACWTN